MDDRTFDDQSIALDWIRTIESDGANVRESDIYPRLNAWVNETAPKKLLDIGCGQGVCSEKLDLSGRKYTGLEPSVALVKRARELYQAENRTFVEGSVYKIPFENQLFDGAFSVAVWHLLGDLGQAAAELSRVLTGDGSFLIISANPEAYDLWTQAYTDQKTVGSRFEGTRLNAQGVLLTDVLYLYTRDQILKSLEGAGLAVEITENFRSNQFLSVRGRKQRT